MTYLGGVLAICAAMLGTGMLQVLVSRYVPAARRQAIHEVGGLVFLNAGVFYALLLSFMLSLVWERFEQAAVAVASEASAAYRAAEACRTLPEPLRGVVRGELRAYTAAALEETASSARPVVAETRADDALDAAWRGLVAFEPASGADTLSRDETARLVSELRTARVVRASHHRRSVPGLLWMLVLAGGVLIVGMTLFFSMPSDTAHAMLSALFAGIIALALVTIGELNDPFGGDLVVSTDPFRAVIASLAEPD